MKKLLLAIGIGLFAGSLYAACTGPYCYDDTGATINATVGLTGNPYFGGTSLVATINASTAPYSNQIIVCSDCVQSRLCISTGTTNCNQWIVVGGTATTGGTLMRCR